MPSLEKHDSPLPTTTVKWRFPSVHPEGRKYAVAVGAAALLAYVLHWQLVGWVLAGLTLARRVGSRYWEYALLGQAYPCYMLGRWDEAVAMRDALPEGRWEEMRIPFFGVACPGIQIAVNRGQLDEGERLVGMLADFGQSGDVQEQGVHYLGGAVVALAKREHEDALRLGERAFATLTFSGLTHEIVKEAFVVLVEAALALGDTATAEGAIARVEKLPVGRQPQFLRAQAARFRGRLAAARGDRAAAERGFKGAAALFREIACPFFMAVTELEHVELGGADDADRLLAEARGIFEELEAAPWLERCDAVVAGTARVPAEAT